MVIWSCTLKSPPSDTGLEQAVQGTTNKVHAGAFERVCLTYLINLNELSKYKCQIPQRLSTRWVIFLFVTYIYMLGCSMPNSPG